MFFIEVQDLGLDGHVQGGHGFVADDELGVHGQSPGDADALAASAVELVGVGVDQAMGQAHGVHQVQHPHEALVAVRDELGQEDGFLDGFRDGLAGVERGERVLEDDLHFPAHVAHFIHAELAYVRAVEGDLAVGGLDEAQDGATHGGLAAAGFADDPERASFLDGETHIVHRLEHSGRHMEVFFEVFHLQQYLAQRTHLVC